MRGGSQAQLVHASDRNSYVVKFSNNPQGRRTLINEFVASHVFRHLGISTPPAALIRVPGNFIQSNSNLRIHRKTRSDPVVDGWHLGALFPGDPDQTTVYDFLPDVMLRKVSNLHAFLGALVADKWLGNTDARQSIFVRTGTGQWKTQMIDHGYCFDATRWRFADSPRFGLHHNRRVYGHASSWSDFEVWLQRVEQFPEDRIWRIASQIPEDWRQGDEDGLRRLIEQLLRHRDRVGSFIEALLEEPNSILSHWNNSTHRRSRATLAIA